MRAVKVMCFDWASRFAAVLATVMSVRSIMIAFLGNSRQDALSQSLPPVDVPCFSVARKKHVLMFLSHTCIFSYLDKTVSTH